MPQGGRPGGARGAGLPWQRRLPHRSRPSAVGHLRPPQHSLFLMNRPAAETGPYGPTSIRLAPAAARGAGGGRGGAERRGLPQRINGMLRSNTHPLASSWPRLTLHHLDLGGKHTAQCAGHAVAKPAAQAEPGLCAAPRQGAARRERAGRSLQLLLVCSGSDSLAKQHHAVPLIIFEVGRHADAGRHHLRECGCREGGQD